MIEETEIGMKIGRSVRFFGGAVALLLCMVTLFSVSTGALTETNLDYGKGQPSDVTLSASELFDELFPSASKLTAGERAALDALAEVSLTHARVPESVIRREYDGDNGILTILVDTYEYTATNGETVIWTPDTVSFNGGKAVKLTDADQNGTYTYSYTGMKESQRFTLDVQFSYTVVIEAEIADRLLTLPYTVAVDAYGRWKPYQNYLEAQKKYEAYLIAKDQYPIDKANYDRYVKEKAEWDTKNQAYTAYLQELSSYNAAMKAYRENEAKKQAYTEAAKKYYDYQEVLKQNAVDLDKYDTYVKNIKLMEEQLKVLDSAYIHVEGNPNWGYYLSIKGPTALSFLNHFSDNSNIFGAEIEKIAKNAKAAGERIAAILIEYDKVRTAKYTGDFEKLMAKYQFYALHYEELCSTLQTFYGEMRKIYCDDVVLMAFNTVQLLKEKNIQFQRMVAHSYILYTAMDDGAVMNPNWTLRVSASGVTKTMGEIVYAQQLLDDTQQGNPSHVSVPESEMTLPNASLELIEKPIVDFNEDMKEPDKPTPVENPGNAPTEVKNPGANPPAEVKKPDVVLPPNPPLTAVESKLVEEYDVGVLKRRDAKQADQMLTLRYNVRCEREFSNRKTVTFYDFDGTLMEEYTFTVDYLDRLSDYAHLFPPKDKATDARYKYYWVGWTYYGVNNANRFYDGDLESIRVTDDLAITPCYETDDILYTVKWIANGATQTQTYKYGEIPQCTLSTARPDEGVIQYRFKGWAFEGSDDVTPVAPVTANVTYVARYDEDSPSYTVTWKLHDMTLTSTVAHGKKPICPVDPTDWADDSYHVFKGWGKQLSPVVANVTYTAQYESRPLAWNDQNVILGIIHSDSNVTVQATDTAVWIEEACAFAVEKGKTLTVQWNGFCVSFAPEQLTAMLDGGVEKLRLSETAGAKQGSVYYRLELRNRFYEISLELPVSVRITRAPADGVVGTVYRVSDTATELDVERYTGELRFDCVSGAELLYQPTYDIKYTDPTQNSYFHELPTRVSEGDVVDINVGCELGYEVTGAILRYSDGRTERVSGTKLVMPAAPVTVELTVERIVFHVVFLVDGTVYKEMDLFFKDFLTLPEAPTKAEDAEYTYSFAGWTPQIWNSAVYLDNRNPVFEAIFTAHVKADSADEDFGGSLTKRVILLGSIGAVAVACLVLGIVYRKRIPMLVRRAVKNFVPFCRKCGTGIKNACQALWTRVLKIFRK